MWVAAGQPIYWRLGGSGITAADFIDGLLGGESVIGRDGQVAFTTTLAADGVVDPENSWRCAFSGIQPTASRWAPPSTSPSTNPPVGTPTDGNDIIIGTAAAELITGIHSGSSLRGSIDQLTSAGSNEIFALRDGNESFEFLLVPTDWCSTPLAFCTRSMTLLVFATRLP
jgi:hypothetical protein